MLKNLYENVPPARMGATSSRNASGTTTPMGKNGHPVFMPIKSMTVSRWTRFSRAITCCICPGCLSICGKKDPLVQQAWREKVFTEVVNA